MIDVDECINKIVRDPIFTRHLAFMRYVINNSVHPIMRYAPTNFIHPLPDPILDRFCLRILPEISHRIEHLNLESSSMKRILLATNYPNLSGLGLFGIQAETVADLFTGKILFCFDFFNDKYIKAFIHLDAFLMI
jgi:hypothetical protein